MTIQLPKVRAEAQEGEDRASARAGEEPRAPAQPGEREATSVEEATGHEPHLGSVDEELRRRLDNLQDAAEKASGHVRNLYLTLLSFGIYLAIIFGSTTHEQLLRESPVMLPLFNVELPLVGFYWVAPALLVLLHFNLLVQGHLLADKLKQLDDVLRGPDGRNRDSSVERARLDLFPLTQMLAGDERSPFVRWLATIITWVTIVLLPVALLVFGQARFLPYHDAFTTWWHRLLVLLDLALLWLLWLTATDLSDSSRRPSRRMLWPFGEQGQHFLKRHWRMLAPTTVIAALASLLWLTIPGEAVLAWPADTLAGERNVPFLPARNLVVRETNLVGSWPTQAQIEQHGEDLAWKNFGAPHSLRGRDLRYADLSQSILVRGDLREASLQGAHLRDTNLRNADLQGTDLDYANLQGANLGRANLQGAYLGHANLQGAVLGEANLQGAHLFSVSLQGAHLGRANLQGAGLVHANLQDASLELANLRGASLESAGLQGANLYGANLRGVNLANVNLQGVFLRGADLREAGLGAANLQGAELADALLESANATDANLRGADLRIANLQGAILEGADLQGAELRSANLQGAALVGANLQGADFTNADMQGTDLRKAKVWRAELGTEPSLYELADLRSLDLAPPAQSDLEQWAADARKIADEWPRERVLEILSRLRHDLGLTTEDKPPWRPNFPPGLAERDDVLFEPVPPPTFADFDPKLAEFLAGLACAPGASPGIARTVASRAIYEDEQGRLYPGLVAKALLGDACPPARELDEEWVQRLRARLRDHLIAELQRIKDNAGSP